MLYAIFWLAYLCVNKGVREYRLRRDRRRGRNSTARSQNSRQDTVFEEAVSPLSQVSSAVQTVVQQPDGAVTVATRCAQPDCKPSPAGSTAADSTNVAAADHHKSAAPVRVRLFASSAVLHTLVWCFRCDHQYSGRGTVASPYTVLYPAVCATCTWGCRGEAVDGHPPLIEGYT